MSCNKNPSASTQKNTTQPNQTRSQPMVQVTPFAALVVSIHGIPKLGIWFIVGMHLGIGIRVLYGFMGRDVAQVLKHRGVAK